MKIPFRLVADIEFEAEDVEDACKFLMKLFRNMSKGKEYGKNIGGNLQIMSLDVENNETFEVPKRINRG